MKSLSTMAFILVTLASFNVAHAATSAKKKNPSLQLSTDVSFDGRLVKGKYQSASEGIATVENDKDIDDLIGVRKHFKDRLEKSESLR